MGFTKILVAIDRSPLTSVVCDRAIDLARKEAARLMIFNCLSLQPEAEIGPFMGTEMGLDPTVGGMTLPLQQERLQQDAEQVQKWLQTYRQKALDQGIATESEYSVGDPGVSICDTAKNWGADLIVLGRRGRQGLTEMLMGSVSNHVLHNAGCSVLVIQGITLPESREN